MSFPWSYFAIIPLLINLLSHPGPTLQAPSTPAPPSGPEASDADYNETIELVHDLITDKRVLNSDRIPCKISTEENVKLYIELLTPYQTATNRSSFKKHIYDHKDSIQGFKRLRKENVTFCDATLGQLCDLKIKRCFFCYQELGVGHENSPFFEPCKKINDSITVQYPKEFHLSGIRAVYFVLLVAAATLLALFHNNFATTPK
jgi:hypothetical protein